jgi:glycosyltransferase involved in cell wall biosynthesis
LQRAKKLLGCALRSVKGVWLEEKSGSMAIHYRGANPEATRKARRALGVVLRSVPGLQCMAGKKVWEVLPPAAMNKAAALEYILKKEGGPTWRAKFRIVYLGDDVTDESVFRSVRGITVVDPEGDAVLQEVLEASRKDPDIHILNLPPWSYVEINALQRASTIVVQKSLREGFGLTITEALWKRKPVVASAVGGIPSQVIHKVTGMLAHSVEGTAYQIRFLLSNPEFARRLGENGHEHVKENFLITQNLKRYLLLFLVHRSSS